MKEIVEQLDKMGLIKYGSVITGELIRGMAGIELPETGTRDQFKDAALKELTITDYIRGKLISKGMYLHATKGDYRILSPSENKDQVLAYMKSADGKLKRGIRLYDNTPKQYLDNNIKTRIHLRQDSINEQKRRRDNLN